MLTSTSRFPYLTVCMFRKYVKKKTFYSIVVFVQGIHVVVRIITTYVMVDTYVVLKRI